MPLSWCRPLFPCCPHIRNEKRRASGGARGRGPTASDVLVLVYCVLWVLVRSVTGRSGPRFGCRRSVHQATAVAEPICQRACGWKRESGSHRGPPVAPNLPMMATAASRRTGPPVSQERSSRRRSAIARTARATPTGSPNSGQAAKRAPSIRSPGSRVQFSHDRPRPATTSSNQARVPSCAHSANDGMGPWNRRDPTPVAIKAYPTHGVLDFLATRPPATTNASVLRVLTGCPSSGPTTLSQSRKAPTTPRYERITQPRKLIYNSRKTIRLSTCQVPGVGLLFRPRRRGNSPAGPNRRVTVGQVRPEGRLAGSRVSWKSRETEAEGLVGVRTGILRDRRAVRTRAD